MCFLCSRELQGHVWDVFAQECSFEAWGLRFSFRAVHRGTHSYATHHGNQLRTPSNETRCIMNLAEQPWQLLTSWFNMPRCSRHTHSILAAIPAGVGQDSIMVPGFPRDMQGLSRPSLLTLSSQRLWWEILGAGGWGIIVTQRKLERWQNKAVDFEIVSWPGNQLGKALL